MSTKERSSADYTGEAESPFLDEEPFVGKSGEEWEPRVAALVAESPFVSTFKAFEERPRSAIVSEVYEEETNEPEAEGFDVTLEWEDPGCAGEQASLDVEAEWFDSEIWMGSADQIAFRGRVLAAHLSLSKKARGSPQPDLPNDALEYVPGTRIRTLPDTAAAAGRLLAAANADLAQARQTSDPDALRTIRLSMTSGYRGSTHQRNLWMGYFSAKGGYYDLTQAAREKLPEGPHSDQAVAYMLKPERYGGFGLSGRIAAPGYSNHQGGIAIDFWQKRRKDHDIKNKSDKKSRARWRSTWFYAWLKANAATYGFKPIPTEEWHWEYRPGTATAPSRSATLPARVSAPANEQIRFAQRVLNATESERLDDDGNLGPLTRAALERFRAKYGLGAGGVLDAKTELALAQRALEELAQASMFAQVGQRDAKTDQVLAAFKSARGLGIDPTLDAATRRALTDALAGRVLSSSVAGDVSVSGYLGGKLWTFTAKTLATRVAVFCPKTALSLGEVEVLVFAHGLLAGCRRPKRIPSGFITDAPFHLGRIIDASGRPMVLVVPFLDWAKPGGEHAFGAGRERWHVLAKPSNLNAVIAEVLVELSRVRAGATPSLRGLILAGHSRAYDFLEPLAYSSADPQMRQDALDKLSQVWAFDTLYGGQVERWVDWLNRDKRLRVAMFYRPGSKTAAIGDKFYARRGARLAVVQASEGHCEVPATRLPVLLKLPAPDQNLFAAGAEEEWEPHPAALVAENPFADALEESRSRFNEEQLEEEESPDEFKGEEKLEGEELWESPEDLEELYSHVHEPETETYYDGELDGEMDGEPEFGDFDGSEEATGDEETDAYLEFETAKPPKGLKLSEHYHIPKKLPDGTVLSTRRLDQQDMNPGFVSLITDDLLVDRRTGGLQTLLDHLIRTKYPRFLATRSSAQEGARAADRIRVALVDLSGSKLFKPDIAGWGSTFPTDGASVPKICALYAVHQLRSDLIHLAAKNSITKKEDLIKAARASWKKIGLSSLPRIEELFLFVVLEDFSRPVSVTFSPDLLESLTKAYKNNDNCAIDQLISQLGFPYIASVMWQSGLRHPTRGGLWLWGGYCCTNKERMKKLLNPDTNLIECKVSGIEGLSFRWKANPVQQPKPVFPHNATALSVATFFSLLAQGRLVDDGASSKIATTLQDACSFFWNSQLGGLSSSFNPPPTKCGIVGKLTHDGILIKRTVAGKEISYAAAALTIGASDFPFEDFLKDLDKIIQDKN